MVLWYSLWYNLWYKILRAASGHWSNDSASDKAKHDCWSILKCAVDKSRDQDMRNEDVYSALRYLNTDLGIAIGYVNAFKESLNIESAENRAFQLQCAYEKIIKHG